MSKESFLTLLSKEAQAPLPFLAPLLSESALGTAARCKALGAGTEEELEAEAITLHH